MNYYFFIIKKIMEKDINKSDVFRMLYVIGIFYNISDIRAKNVYNCSAPEKLSSFFEQIM